MAASAGSPPASWRAWRRLGIPAIGYGIRYDHGLFRQVIRDGWQQEYPEDWLSFGNPWEFERPEVVYDIHFGGRVERGRRAAGRARGGLAPGRDRAGGRLRHADRRLARPARQHAAAVVGARADPLKLDAFNTGDHVGASPSRRAPRRSRKVLYPSDETPAGRELRLRQEYFFVSASLQDSEAAPRAYGDLRLAARRPRSSSTTPIRASPSPS
jgi:starch phosphorylase